MALYSVNTTEQGIQQDAFLITVVSSFRFDPTLRLRRGAGFVDRLAMLPEPVPGRVFGLHKTAAADVYSNGAMVTHENKYFEGGTLDAGIMAVSVSKEFTLYITSFFPTNQTIASVFVTPGQSVSVLEPVPGDILYRHTSIPLVVRVSEEGLAQIRADVVVTLSNGKRLTFKVTAIRPPIGWFFLAQWRDGLEYSRRFLTAIETAESGAEIRKVLRNSPVREVSIPLTAIGADHQYFAQMTLKAATETEQLIPMYTDKSLVTAPCVGTTFRIYCATYTYRFKVGGLAVICKKATLGASYFEMVEITTIHSDGLTVRYPLGDNYDKGDHVYPLEECVIQPKGMSIKVLTSDKTEATITATSKYGTVALENPTYSPASYLGLPVYPFRTNWEGGLDVDITSPAVLTDSGRGQKNYITYGRAYSSWRVTSFFATRDEYWAAVGFFNYLKGRGKPFFMAHPIDWLPLDNAIDNHTFALTEDTFGPDIDGTLKYLYVSNGTTSEIVKVENVYTSGTKGAVIETTTPSIATVTAIAQAVPVRLESDEIVESWLTDGCVEIRFEVRELPEA